MFAIRAAPAGEVADAVTRTMLVRSSRAIDVERSSPSAVQLAPSRSAAAAATLRRATRTTFVAATSSGSRES